MWEAYERQGKKGAFLCHWVSLKLGLTGSDQQAMGLEQVDRLMLLARGQFVHLGPGSVTWELGLCELYLMGFSCSCSISGTIWFRILCSDRPDGAWHGAYQSIGQEIPAETFLACSIRPLALVKYIKLEVLSGTIGLDPFPGIRCLRFKIHGILAQAPNLLNA